MIKSPVNQLNISSQYDSVVNSGNVILRGIAERKIHFPTQIWYITLVYYLRETITGNTCPVLVSTLEECQNLERGSEEH